MDRNTEDTLSTYNTWIQLSRLQNIYHFQHILIKFVNKESLLRLQRCIARGPKPTVGHVEPEMVDNTASPAWIPT